MPITAIKDRSLVTLTELKEHLKLPAEASSQDDDLTRKLNAAKTAADNYCQNEFLDAEGEPGDIPDDVEQWILQKATDLYKRRGNNDTNQSVQGMMSQDYKEFECYGLLKASRRNPGLGMARVTADE